MATITVSSGQTSVVNTSTSNAYVVSGGGILDIVSGGTVAGTIAVASGGTVSVANSGNATSTNTISAGGNEIILSGGSVGSAVVASGGTETVVAGGVLTAATVSAGGILAVSGGTVSSSLALAGIATGTKTFSWPASGGTSAVVAIGETVASSGTINVSSRLSTDRPATRRRPGG